MRAKKGSGKWPATEGWPFVSVDRSLMEVRTRGTRVEKNENERKFARETERTEVRERERNRKESERAQK